MMMMMYLATYITYFYKHGTRCGHYDCIVPTYIEKKWQKNVHAVAILTVLIVPTYIEKKCQKNVKPKASYSSVSLRHDFHNDHFN